MSKRWRRWKFFRKWIKWLLKIFNAREEGEPEGLAAKPPMLLLNVQLLSSFLPLLWSYERTAKKRGSEVPKANTRGRIVAGKVGATRGGSQALAKQRDCRPQVMLTRLECNFHVQQKRDKGSYVSSYVLQLTISPSRDQSSSYSSYTLTYRRLAKLFYYRYFLNRNKILKNISYSNN